MRQLFGGGIADTVYVSNAGTVVEPGEPVTITFWGDPVSSVTQITDLTDYYGNPLTQISTDTDGSIPLFYGPAAGNVYMFADANGGAGPRKIVIAYPATPNIPWLPSDSGFQVTNGSVAQATTSQLLVAGAVYVNQVFVRSPVTVSKVGTRIVTLGSGTSTGSFEGIYSSAGVLLGETADLDSNWTSSFTTPNALSGGPLQLNPGNYYFAKLCNLSGTQVTLATIASSQQAVNVNASGAGLLAAVAATGRTTLPASFTPSALTASGSFAFFAGGA